MDTTQRKSTETVLLTQTFNGMENQEQELDEHYWDLIDDHGKRHREAACALNGTTDTNTTKEEEKEERKHCNLFFFFDASNCSKHINAG